MESDTTRVRKQRWMLLYEKAVSEPDENKRLDLIALAKGAIFQRKQELAHLRTNHLQELEALGDANYVLAGLRRAAEFNRSR